MHGWNTYVDAKACVCFSFKKIVSRDEKICLKVLKIKLLLSEYKPIVFKLFCCLVMEKLKDKVLACFYENTY
jgi:hypothetical protein